MRSIVVVVENTSAETAVVAQSKVDEALASLREPGDDVRVILNGGKSMCFNADPRLKVARLGSTLPSQDVHRMAASAAHGRECLFVDVQVGGSHV